jgi:hypothetical protein
MASAQKRTAYLFLDEGGNLDFTPKAPSFFTLTSVLMYRPFVAENLLHELKFDLLERGWDIEYFHATTDKQAVRDRVFTIIKANLSQFRIDSVVVRKRKTHPKVRSDVRFYPENLGYLLSYVLHPCNTSMWSDVIIITDTLPLNRKRDAIRKAIQQALAARLPGGVPYRILHHASKSCCGLQVADYCNWAIYRKWENNDLRSYVYVQPALRSEFDVFRCGHTDWY